MPRSKICRWFQSRLREGPKPGDEVLYSDSLELFGLDRRSENDWPTAEILCPDGMAVRGFNARFSTDRDEPNKNGINALSIECHTFPGNADGERAADDDADDVKLCHAMRKLVRAAQNLNSEDLQKDGDDDLDDEKLRRLARSLLDGSRMDDPNHCDASTVRRLMEGGNRLKTTAKKLFDEANCDEEGLANGNKVNNLRCKAKDLFDLL